MISTTYDPEADAMFIRFAPDDVRVAGSAEAAPGIVLDYDDAGVVIGIEVLDVSSRLSRQSRRSRVIGGATQ